MLLTRTHASAFLGVARFGVAFLVAAAFLAGAFFPAALGAAALVFVTRPDLVLLKTAKSSLGSAGAGTAALRGLLALAFGFAAGFAAAVFFVVALVAVAFLAAGALAFCRDHQHAYSSDKYARYYLR